MTGGEVKATEAAEKPTYLGMFAQRATPSALSGVELAALGISVLWVIGTVLFFSAGGGGNTLGKLAAAVAVLAALLPVGFLWLAVFFLRSARMLQDEAERLQSAINGMRHAFIQQKQSGVLDVTPAFSKKLEEIAAAQRSTDAKLARFTAIRPELEKAASTERSALQVSPVQAEVQPALALGTPADRLDPPLSVADFIRALNFPDDAEDKEGFRALRRALSDRAAAQLIQAAQDVLTLLSQDGIYMDDLQPDRARPEVWRRFARGERGKQVAILGGIRDRSSLALSAGRMRADTIFRDSVHHFLRKFDHTFSEFEKSASDLEIAALTDTRTARGFMLLGRVTGTFD